MLYRRFGRTELAMPVFSCGGMRYQQAWKDLPPDQIATEGQRNLEATIHAAIAQGINHIETARGYGTSEMQLGYVLPKLPRDQIIVQTKVSPTADPQEFRRKFEQSLRFLQLDYVDLLGIHGINNAETFQNAMRCLELARQWQAQGKVRHVGFSTHGPTEVIVQAINTGALDYVNLHWYYINQANWPAIAAATEQDMGVFIISPSDKGGHLYNPPPKLVELCQPLSPMVFNDLFCLSHPQVHTLSLGAAKPTDFAEHLKVLPLLDRAAEILPPILHRLEQAAIAAFEDYFGPGQGEAWLKGWQRGLPKLEETPGEVAIGTILWLWNLITAFDMTDYAKARYNLLGNGGHWFPGQRADRLTELDLTPCLARSPYAHHIPELLAQVHNHIGGQAVQRLSQS